MSYSIDQSTYRLTQIQEHERIDSLQFLKEEWVAHIWKERIDGSHLGEKI